MLAQLSKGSAAQNQRVSHILRREKGIWQRRFRDHHIRDKAEYQACIRYCWINPVKHGFLERAEDWPYSPISGANHSKAFAKPQGARQRTVGRGAVTFRVGMVR